MKYCLKVLSVFLLVCIIEIVNAQEPIENLSPQLTLPVGHFYNLSDLKFSPDNKYLIGLEHRTGFYNGRILIWDLETGKVVREIGLFNYWIQEMALSPDGAKIVTTPTGSCTVCEWNVKVWDFYSGHLLKSFHGGQGSKPIISPDNKQFVLAHLEGGYSYYHLEGKDTTRIKYDVELDQSFLEDKSKKVYSYSEVLQLMNNTDKKMYQHLSWPIFENQQFIVERSEDQQYLAISDDTDILVWDVKNKKLLWKLQNHIQDVSWQNDHKTFLSLDKKNKERKARINRWDVENLKITEAMNVKYQEDDGISLIEAPYGLDEETSNKVFEFLGLTPEVEIFDQFNVERSDSTWDIKSNLSDKILASYPANFGLLAISPNEKFIVLDDREKGYVLDTKSGEKLYPLDGNARWAIFSPDDEYLILLRDDFYLEYRESRSGKVLNEMPITPARDYKVPVFSEDGLFIYGENKNELKCWSSKTGEELYTLVAIDSVDWAVVSPSGLFDASPGAMLQLYFLVGKEIIELDQLKDRYYEPNLLQKIINGKGEGLRNVKEFGQLKLYPKVKSTIENDTLHIELSPRNGGIGNVEIYVEGKRRIADANPNRRTNLKIPLVQFARYYNYETTNVISIRVYNEEGWLKSSAVNHSYKPDFINGRGDPILPGGSILPVTSANPEFYALIIGTSDYNGDEMDLRFADKDALAITDAVSQTATLLFGNDQVHIQCFTSKKTDQSRISSKENIREAFEQLKNKVNVNDVVMVFLSGHGTTYGTNEKEQFYYLTKDVRTVSTSDPQTIASYWISSEELTKWANDLPARKQLMILDACYSGKMVDAVLTGRSSPTAQTRALDRMKDKTGIFVLSGSAADKESFEASPFGQGLLTHSLLMGMSGAALRDNQSVDVMQLFQYALDRVPEVASDFNIQQKPTLAAPTYASSFDIGLKTDEVKIPLAEIKPIFLTSNFQEENEFDDVLGLSKKIDSYLKNELSKELIFGGDGNYKNAYALRGRYEINGTEVKLKVKLFKNKKKVKDFKELFLGSTNDPQSLVFTLVNAIVSEMNSSD